MISETEQDASRASWQNFRAEFSKYLDAEGFSQDAREWMLADIERRFCAGDRTRYIRLFDISDDERPTANKVVEQVMEQVQGSSNGFIFQMMLLEIDLFRAKFGGQPGIPTTPEGAALH